MTREDWRVKTPGASNGGSGILPDRESGTDGKAAPERAMVTFRRLVGLYASVSIRGVPPDPPKMWTRPVCGLSP